MKNAVPKRPELLVGYLAKLIAGDDAHQQEGVLPKELRADLDAMKAELESRNKSVQLSRGRYRQDAQGRNDLVRTVLERAERARDVVHGKYGHQNEVLADFGLATRKKRNKATVKASKAERAQARVAKIQALLEKAKLRKSRLEAELAQRVAEAAVAVPVTPPEPAPGSEPTPPSNGK